MSNCQSWSIKCTFLYKQIKLYRFIVDISIYIIVFSIWLKWHNQSLGIPTTPDVYLSQKTNKFGGPFGETKETEVCSTYVVKQDCSLAIFSSVHTDLWILSYLVWLGECYAYSAKYHLFLAHASLTHVVKSINGSISFFEVELSRHGIEHAKISSVSSTAIVFTSKIFEKFYSLHIFA